MLKIPAIIAKVETMSDGGMKLVINTQELKPKDKAELMELHSKIGWLLFSDVDVQASDIPDEPIEFDGDKSPSKSLRDTLWVYHQKQGGKAEDFTSYWHKYVEQQKNKIKAKIDELE